MKVIPFFIIFVETIRYMKFQALKVKTPEEILISDIEYLKVVFERMISLESKNDIYREIVEKQEELILKLDNEESSEIKYTEDEVRELLIKGLTHNDDKLCGSLVTVQKEIRTANFNVWFEENKKK